MQDKHVTSDDGELHSFSATVIPATPTSSSSIEPSSATGHARLSPFLEPPALHRTSTDSAFSEFSFFSDDDSAWGDHGAPIPPASRTWRRSLHQTWLRNKGVAHVLISQIFAAGMNIATRILETDGVHGPAMVCSLVPPASSLKHL